MTPARLAAVRSGLKSALALVRAGKAPGTFLGRMSDLTMRDHAYLTQCAPDVVEGFRELARGMRDNRTTARQQRETWGTR